jgi:hypothetical protein
MAAGSYEEKVIQLFERIIFIGVKIEAAVT